MGWDDIKGQELAKRVLLEHLAAGTVANAYLLAGPDGVGKRLLAHEMAKALNCTGEGPRPCGVCPSCGQIARQTHPDVHWVQPEGAAGLIRIDEIRRVLGRVALRPFSGRYQVVIIDPAERITEEAANSLLKTLEEPSAHTCFLLLTPQLSRCLPTIVSRCQAIRCRRLSPEMVQTILRKAGACAEDDAPTIAHLAGGSAARAMELAGRWTAHQALLRRFSDDRPAAWLEGPLPETRDETQQLLEGMLAWLRDVAVAATADLAWVAQRDAGAALMRQASRIDPARCVETALELVGLTESLERFVSPRLVATLAREHWLALVTPDQ